ncbi:hypothetical protein INT48_005368, partial [Thamnidium elegans]
MDDEVDICRVCHSESTQEQPLFHPCKCSGSIRHIHQECLIEWLSHKIVNYLFAYKIKLVYRSDMPEVIPPSLIFQQFNKKIISGLLFALRATFVGFIWLIILPYITVWIWRLYFFIGDHVSVRLFKLQEVKHQLGLNTSTLNLTSIFFTALSDNDTVTANWIQEYKSRFSMHAFFSDCFEGQIITSIVVVFFISVFLLKEWIIQNIPMEVLPLDDEPQVFEPAFQEELIQPDPPSPRFDDLFDGDWGEEDNEQPHIYADLNRGHADQATNLTQFELPVPNERVRAASMPPNFGVYRASATYDEQEDVFDRDEYHFRRAVSMEPAIDTTMLRPLPPPFNPQTPVYPGTPPFAPRMRHAEANMPIRPIIEEIELPVAIEPLVVEPIAEEENVGEENVEEFEGILEAIGMDGNLVSLVQNSTLMGLLIALILGVTVWIPYLIGMLFIMTDTFDLIRIPLELVRMITDPLIDFLFLVWPDYIWPFICNLYHSCIQPLLESTALFDKVAHMFTYVKDYLLLFVDPSLPDTIATNHNVTENVLDQSIQHIARFINETEPLMEHALNRYQQFATGQTVIDRLACIAIGYVVVISVSTWYLSGDTRDNLTTALFGLTAQEAFRHQCIVLKVGFFLFLELILFPIVCGFVINVSTIPLFKEATFLSRGQFLMTHPIIFIFLHWTIGTLFMFLFTLLVTVCRDILRSGVMWFIRDPGDPQFHPVREIAERPALTQLKKIGASAFIYILIILVGIAGVIQCIKSIGAGILPLRWNLSDPISVIPVDIIMLQVAVPAFIKNFKPTSLLLSISVKWLRFVCRKLRLTSFMFGKRKSREEGTLVYHTWWAWIRRIEPERVPRAGTQESLIGDEVSYIWTGQLLRVPGHDNVPIVGNRRMLVPVYPDTLEPIDETERILGHPAANAPGGNDTNTAIVYSPPHLIRRLVLFAVIMWLSSTTAFCYMTLFPVVLGRLFFKEAMMIETEVHDLYSFILGISVLFYIGYSIVVVYKTICDIWARPTWIQRIRRSRSHLKKWSRRTLHWGWFITWFAIVLPLVFGILFKLYISFPLTSVEKEPVTIKLVPVWSQGLSCMLVCYRFIQYAPPGPAKDMIDDIFRQGIGKMDIKTSFTKLIAPLLIASICAGCLPFATAYANIFITDLTNPELRKKVMQLAYP